jgi:PAS domain S-box-containing protein
MGKAAQAQTLDTQLFRDAFSASPIGIVVETLEGQPLFLNRAFCSFLGFSEDELRRRHCVDFSPPEDAEKDWTLFQRLRAGSIDHYQLEKRYFRRDGSLVWSRLSLSLLNSRPSPLVIAMVEDITEKKRAEEALRESETRFRFVSDTAPVMIWMSGVDKLCTYFNKPWLDFTGRSIERELGNGWAEGIHKDDIQRCLETYTQSFDRREKFQMEYRLRQHDGDYRWIFDIGVPRYGQEGTFAGYIGSCIDVTERRRAEEARFSHAAIVESSEDAIISKNKDAIILSWNAGAERIFGYTEAEAVGQPITIIIPPELRDEESKILERLRAGGHIEHYETIRVTKTGKRVDVSLNIGPVKDSSGNVIGFSKIAHDISTRKMAEQALREGEQRLRLAQWAARVGTFDVNLRTGVDIWTPETEALYGLPAGGFGGTLTAFENLIHPDDRKRITELTREMTRTGQPTEAEWRVIWPDGSIHWIAGRGQVFMDESGEPSRLLGLNIDITERKQAEEALGGMTRKLIEAQEQDRARIGRDLHDDITQQLALLAIDIEQLRQKNRNSAAETSTGLTKIRDRVNAIAADVQSISHQLHSPQLEMLGIVATIRGFCREFAARQKVTVDFTHDNIPEGVSHEVSLCIFRVLQEALHNAVKHSHVRRYKVNLGCSANKLHLTVSDRGIGFDAEVAMSRGGLGLVSMRERVRLVNGTIAIDSVPQHGTRIDVCVPIGLEQKSQRAAG